MSKNNIYNIKYFDRGYFKKASMIFYILSIILLLLSVLAYKKVIIAYFLLVIIAVLLFQQGRNLAKSHSEIVYIRIDNLSIEINNKYTYYTGQKKNINIKLLKIRKAVIENSNKKLTLYLDNNKYNVYLKAMSESDEKNLLARLEKKTKIVHE
ncbi:MAG: hypothetical protein LBR30_01245 [Clostridioides sp.]|nr:hypothetical protein [Clostridioides sp.]